MGKRVTLSSGTVFNTLTSAKLHFNEMREAVAVGSSLLEPHKSDVLDLYRRYCVATDWDEVDAVDVVAQNVVKQVNGRHVTSKALAVVPRSGGAPTPFSLDKALTAIAESV